MLLSLLLLLDAIIDVAVVVLFPFLIIPNHTTRYVLRNSINTRVKSKKYGQLYIIGAVLVTTRLIAGAGNRSTNVSRLINGSPQLTVVLLSDNLWLHAAWP